VSADQVARENALNQMKSRPTINLVQDHKAESQAQIMWRISLPVAALNLALLAIPLGAVNPRLGRSGDLLLAGLTGLLYMNLINLMRGWISNGKLDFLTGTLSLHVIVFLLCLYAFRSRMRLKTPKKQAI